MNIEKPLEEEEIDSIQDPNEDPNSTEPSAGIDPAVLSESIADGFRRAISQQQQHSQQPLTQEQINKLLNRPEINDEIARSILGEMDDYSMPIKGLNQLIDQISAHAQQVAKAYVMDLHQRIESTYSPLLAERERQIHNNFVRDIVNTYPALKDKTKFLDTTIRSMQQEGYSPKDRQAAIQDVAARAAALISQASPGFDLKQQQDQHMPTLGDGFGGSGGPGFGSPVRSTKPSGVEVFD